MRYATRIFLLLITAACTPTWVSDELVTVTGTLLPEGGCNATSPRGSVVDTSAKGNLYYSKLSESGGVAVHYIVCAEVDPATVDDRPPHLTLMLHMPGDSTITPGTYPIQYESHVDRTVNVSFHHPGYELGTEGSGFGEMAATMYLAGVTGNVVVTKVDTIVSPKSWGNDTTLRLQARIEMQAHRVWSW